MDAADRYLCAHALRARLSGGRAKDPKRRLSAIGDARLALDEPSTSVPMITAPAAPRAASRAGWVAALLMTGVAASVAGWAGWFRAPAAAPLMRVTVQAPQEHRLYRDPANATIAPDGTRLAFITGVSRSDAKLCVRLLDQLDAIAVEDSIGAQLPFWSPDSTMVGFFAGGHLKVVSAGGGRPQTLAEAPDGRGATWGVNGDIVFAASSAGPISRVSANGGAVTSVTELRSADGETGHRFPWFLPDGVHFLFAALPSKSNQFAIYSAALGSTTRELVLEAETAPLYADPGYLIYSRKGVLVAHPFDARSRTASGEAMPVGDMPGEVNLEYYAGWAASASRTGSLVYLSAAQSQSRLAWLDQAGREVGTVNVPSAPYFGVGLSRDGRRAVVVQLAAPPIQPVACGPCSGRPESDRAGNVVACQSDLVGRRPPCRLRCRQGRSGRSLYAGRRCRHGRGAVPIGLVVQVPGELVTRRHDDRVQRSQSGHQQRSVDTRAVRRPHASPVPANEGQ